MGVFTLDSSTLAVESLTYRESIIEGIGRSAQITWAQNKADQDFEHLGYALRFAATEPEAQDTSSA